VRFVEYATVDRVAVITLNRPEKANAQNSAMLGELDECWDAAATDADVRVILLQANGRHFSSGMELSPAEAVPQGAQPEGNAPAPFPNIPEIAKTLARRNVAKPSIAAVQGKCIAAGLLLCWPCDLIIAAENAEFLDPTARMGLAGVQYMAHAWEIGPRKAKEMLFRSTPVTAREAMELGMVNRVVPLERLRDEAMGWAREIAGLDPGRAALIKRSINGTLDTQGFTASIWHSFDLLELAYSFSPRDEGGSSTLEHMRRTNAGIEDREVNRKGESEDSAP
jgi:enoyl-CoA hydratase